MISLYYFTYLQNNQHQNIGLSKQQKDNIWEA